MTVVQTCALPIYEKRPELVVLNYSEANAKINSGQLSAAVSNIIGDETFLPVQLRDILLIGRIRTALTQSLILVLISSFCQRDILLTSPHRSTILTATIILIMLHLSSQRYTVMLKRTHIITV